MTRDRIVDIETKLAYQEDTIQALNDVVSRQQKQIEQLELTCKLLAGRLAELAEAAGGGAPTEEAEPPH